MPDAAPSLLMGHGPGLRAAVVAAAAAATDGARCAGWLRSSSGAACGAVPLPFPDGSGQRESATRSSLGSTSFASFTWCCTEGGWEPEQGGPFQSIGKA